MQTCLKKVTQSRVSSSAKGLAGEGDGEHPGRATGEHPWRADLHTIAGSEVTTGLMQGERQILGGGQMNTERGLSFGCEKPISYL
jgi:hypothetical protein